tara:strand:+ start:451 stop:627 length:177 start_codon:yes stop_codon:yes gene_type:complete
LLYIRGDTTPLMPRNELTREEIKIRVLRLKYEMRNENDAEIGNKYLDKVLDILDEYRY